MFSERRPLAALALGAPGGLIFAAAGGLASSASPGAMRLGLVALVTALALMLLACAGACLSRRGWCEVLGLEPGRMGAGRVALLVAGTIGLSHLLDELIGIAGLREGSVLETVDSALIGARGLSLLVVILGIGIAPGLGEELFFRGLLLRSLAPRVGSLFAVTFSALLFGALHLDPVQGAAATLLGLYLGLVAVAGGSVRAAVACHIGNNLAAIFTVSAPETGWAILLGCSGLGAIGVAAALTTPSGQPEEPGPPREEGRP
jgi:membrane protease YdiL (CAAX protease family)